MDGFNREQKLAMLLELCHELIRLGVKPGLSDARPALSVRTELAHRKVWVEVDASGEAFVWRRDDHERHALDDPAGAAARLAEYVRRRDAGSGERS